MTFTIDHLLKAKELLKDLDEPKRIFLSPKNYEIFLKNFGLEPPYMNQTNINGTIFCRSSGVLEDEYFEVLEKYINENSLLNRYKK